jgi:hypothetical protein
MGLISDFPVDSYSTDLPEALINHMEKDGLGFATLGPDDAYFVTHPKGGWHASLSPTYMQNFNQLKLLLGNNFDRSIKGVSIVFDVCTTPRVTKRARSCLDTGSATSS